jgi:hypothetical protein
MIRFKEYFVDSSGHALVPFFSKTVLFATFYDLLILIGLVVATWPWQGLIVYMKDQRIPYTFAIVFIGLLVVQTYLNVRLGRGEIGVSYHFTREKIHQQYLPTEVMTSFIRYGLIKSCLHIVVLLLPALPILLLVTAISGYSLLASAKALSVVAAATLLCRLWGFLLYILWGNTSIIGYFFARVFLAGVIYLSAFLKIPVNPIRIIYRTDVDATLSQSSWAQPYVLYMFMTSGCILVFIVLCERFTRHRRIKEEAKRTA